MSLSFPPQRKPRRRNGKDLISCLDHPWLKGVKLPWWSKMPAAQQRKALHSAEPPSLGRCRQGVRMCTPPGQDPGSPSMQNHQ